VTVRVSPVKFEAGGDVVNSAWRPFARSRPSGVDFVMRLLVSLGHSSFSRILGGCLDLCLYLIEEALNLGLALGNDDR
jgi:hypothetical protein